MKVWSIYYTTYETNYCKYVQAIAIYLIDHLSQIGVLMEIIVHYPSSESGRRALARKVAEIHVDCIEKFLDKSGYTRSEKRELLIDMIQNTKENKQYED